MSEAGSVCFTCIKEYRAELVSINEVDTDKVSYLEKLVVFVPNLIQTSSMQICKSCIKMLKVSYNFHKLIQKSQESWGCEQIFSSSIENDKFGNNLDEFLIPKRELEEIEEEFIEEEFKSFKKESDDQNNSLEAEDEATFDEEEVIKLKITDELEKNKSKKVVKLSNEVVYCISCNKRFFRIQSYYNHLVKSHGMEISKEERKFSCQYCEKSFKKMFHLSEHETTHTGEKKHSCPICEKKFQRASSKARHMKNYHVEGGKTKKTPYLCTICGKSFPYSNGAQRHMRTHTGERKFHCELCGKKFAQSTHLHVHMRVHTGEKPYVCDHCGETFSIRASLLKHIKNHEKKNKTDKNIKENDEEEVQIKNNYEENSEEEIEAMSSNIQSEYIYK